MNNRNTYRGQFAAYFAGKLSADEAAALEQALARDAKLAREADALRPAATALAAEAGEHDAEFRLSADRIALIRATASRHIVEFPLPAQPARRDLPLWRKLAPGLAAAVAVVAGALSGFHDGRDSFDANPGSWQVATQVEASDSAAQDPVHYYPPAYGLDHHVYWPSRATAGFAVHAPAHYGLPGPAPVIFHPGDIVNVQ